MFAPFTVDLREDSDDQESNAGDSTGGKSMFKKISKRVSSALINVPKTTATSGTPPSESVGGINSSVGGGGGGGGPDTPSGVGGGSTKRGGGGFGDTGSLSDNASCSQVSRRRRISDEMIDYRHWRTGAMFSGTSKPNLSPTQ